MNIKYDEYLLNRWSKNQELHYYTRKKIEILPLSSTVGWLGDRDELTWLEACAIYCLLMLETWSRDTRVLYCSHVRAGGAKISRINIMSRIVSTFLLQMRWNSMLAITSINNMTCFVTKCTNSFLRFKTILISSKTWYPIFSNINNDFRVIISWNRKTNLKFIVFKLGKGSNNKICDLTTLNSSLRQFKKWIT